MDFIDTLISEAFQRCYGLKDSLRKAIITEDMLLYNACIDTLQSQTGLRRDYLILKLMKYLNKN